MRTANYFGEFLRSTPDFTEEHTLLTPPGTGARAPLARRPE